MANDFPEKLFILEKDGDYFFDLQPNDQLYLYAKEEIAKYRLPQAKPGQPNENHGIQIREVDKREIPKLVMKSVLDQVKSTVTRIRKPYAVVVWFGDPNRQLPSECKKWNYEDLVPFLNGTGELPPTLPN